MTDTHADAPSPAPNRTDVKRASGRELVITRTIDAPARLVFAAWSRPELLMRWWAPESFGITFLSCEADVRSGGRYRFVFGHPDFPEPMAFFGRYLEVIAPRLIVWTNEESEEGSVTTLRLSEEGGKTRMVLSDLYPSEAALEAAIASGSTGAYPEQFEALDALLGEIGADPAG